MFRAPLKSEGLGTLYATKPSNFRRESHVNFWRDEPIQTGAFLFLDSLATIAFRHLKFKEEYIALTNQYVWSIWM